MIKTRKKWTAEHRKNFAAAMASRRKNGDVKVSEAVPATRTRRPKYVYVERNGKFHRFKLQSVLMYIPIRWKE